MAGLLIEDQLAAFLRAELTKTMRWGTWDCGLRIADWLIERLGVPDAAAHLRGRYTDQQSCEALVGAPYPVVIGRLIRRAGLHRTATPGAGDIGVIRQPGGAPIGAIRTKAGWTFPAAKGLCRIPAAGAPLMLAWSVG